MWRPCHQYGGCWVPVRQAVPKEQWDTINEFAPPTPSAEVLPGRIIGLEGVRPRTVGLSAENPPPIDLSQFSFDRLEPLDLPLSTTALPAGAVPGPACLSPHDDGRTRMSILLANQFRPVALQLTAGRFFVPLAVVDGVPRRRFD